MEFEFERTDRAVDRVIAGDPRALPLAAQLREVLVLEVSPETEVAHLVAIARGGGRAPIPHTASPRRRFGRALVASLAAAIVLSLGASSALAASSSATPGDALYGLKRAAERVSLAMHRSPSSRAEFHLRLAERRLTEIRAMLKRGDDPSAVDRDLSAELDEAQHEAERAVALGHDDDALLAHVQAQLEMHLSRLNVLLGLVPASARAGIQNAIDHATNAHERVQQGRREHQDRDKATPSPSATPSHGKPSQGTDKNRGNGNSNGNGNGNGEGPDKASDHTG